jgi:hypothetical protein
MLHRPPDSGPRRDRIDAAENAAANLQRRPKPITDFFDVQKMLDLMASISGRLDLRPADVVRQIALRRNVRPFDVVEVD